MVLGLRAVGRKVACENAGPATSLMALNAAARAMAQKPWSADPRDDADAAHARKRGRGRRAIVGR